MTWRAFLHGALRSANLGAIATLRASTFARRYCLMIAACLLALGTLSTVAAEAAEPKALDEYFRGRVIALEDGVVTLRYDFRKPEQVKDFLDRIPYRIKTRKGQGIKWFDDKLEVMGNAGARHVAEWIGNVHVTATFVPDLKKDFGGYLSPVSETEDFATFTFVETFFHAYDGSAGGMNSIIKFGAQWRESGSADEYIGFRYGPRKPPKVKPAIGKAIRASFGLERKKLFFTLPEYELRGSEKGKRLKHFHVGFYAINGRLLLDNIEIRGTLAKDWMKRQMVELRTAKPIGGEAGASLDDETRALMQKHADGSRRATRALLDILKDESRSETVREAVAKALSTGPKRAVRSAIDLLYHAQVDVRAYGIRIIKTLLGKDFGYKPKASEKRRSAAVDKLNQALTNNPGLLED